MASPTEPEIQFLGNWNSKQSGSFSSSVSAIVLTYTTPNSSEVEHSMTFSKDTAPVVDLGRNPVDTIESSITKASFTSPVVSRNHAKVTFEDGGGVFIIDTNSHHGTWLTRSGDPVKLTPEIPRQLQDGDKITLGKEVIKDGNLHQPVCITVKLLHSSISESPMSISNGSPPSVLVSPKPPRRFGLQPSSESENSEEESENESFVNRNEVQEIHVQDNAISFEPPSLSPRFETGQSLFSSVSPSESSDSSAPDDIEPTSEVTPNEAAPSSPEVCLSSLGNPPWRHLPSSIWRRLPMARQIPSPPSRFERLFGARPRVEASSSHTEPADHHDSHRHFFHHHGHHTHHEKEMALSKESNEDTASKLSERLTALAKEIDKLEERHVRLPMLRDMTTGVASDTETLLAANLQKVRESVNLLQSDMATMKSYKNGIQTDIRFLRADYEARGEEIKDMKASNETEITELRESFKSLERSLVDTKSDLSNKVSELKELYRIIQSDISNLQEELQKARGDTAQLVESSLVRTEKEMNDLRAAQVPNERMREELKGEVGKMIEEYCTTTPVLGKRKRDQDDIADETDEINCTHRTPQMKRSRLATKIVTASVVGAVGAWLGLAFL